MSAIGQTARFVRERRGLTQRAAAEAHGVSAVHLSNDERGRTPPSAAQIARFKADYYYSASSSFVFRFRYLSRDRWAAAFRAWW
jgi:transcriptional regulator with XRE-family HTH domain